MITGGAAILFTMMLVTGLLSLGRDLLASLGPAPDQALRRAAQAEARRIAALPRERQPLRAIAGDARAGCAGRTQPALPVRRRPQPALAAAA